MILHKLIYVNECLGKDRKPIQIYKLRTMDLDANGHLEDVLQEICDSFGKPIVDSRVTEFGKFLRKYWIDELPQLYNLTRGDIKLVGIRPMQKVNWQIYPQELMDRALKQKPGFFGVQYAHLNTPSFDDHVAHLVDYLDRWDEDPVRTEREYLVQIVQNILCKGMRSR